MPITFEEQFKYRDESNLNAAWFRIRCDSKNHCGAALGAARPGLLRLCRWQIDNHRDDDAECRAARRRRNASAALPPLRSQKIIG
ncbi:MAG TPA: hypothetical protein VGC77_16590 [Rhodopseudomonas sp.]|uniref:hypothetical protein n=1 Tax=Rhodopseudomonas sp. TaxID=1078 RepID=UPI002EDA2BAA